jgi:hypothetical protein
MAKMQSAQHTVRTLASSIRSSTLPIALRISARGGGRAGQKVEGRGSGARRDRSGRPDARVSLPPPPSPEKNSTAGVLFCLFFVSFLLFLGA